ncbi:MAG: hypothetical protein KDN22_22480 [Verrucomicrobiae bacterium]|nr:hypothetical protein [Verrucomicrobiae bacterium]
MNEEAKAILAAMEEDLGGGSDENITQTNTEFVAELDSYTDAQFASMMFGRSLQNDKVREKIGLTDEDASQASHRR